MNPYQVLGVSPSASEVEIKRAYRRLSRKHHPDAGGNPDEFDRICKAYSMLTSNKQGVPVMRKKYLRHVTLFTYAVAQ